MDAGAPWARGNGEKKNGSARSIGLDDGHSEPRSAPPQRMIGPRTHTHIAWAHPSYTVAARTEDGGPTKSAKKISSTGIEPVTVGELLMLARLNSLVRTAV